MLCGGNLGYLNSKVWEDLIGHEEKGIWASSLRRIFVISTH